MHEYDMQFFFPRFYSHPEQYIFHPCISAAAIFRYSTTTMSAKDSADVDAVARVGLEKLGYKQEMSRVCACSCFFIRVSYLWSLLV